MSLTFSTLQNELFAECLVQMLRFSTPRNKRGKLKGTTICGPSCDTGVHYALIATFDIIGVGEDIGFCTGVSKYDYNEIPAFIGSNASRFGIDVPWMVGLFFEIARYDPDGLSVVEHDLEDFFPVPQYLNKFFTLLVACDFAVSKGDLFAWSQGAAIPLAAEICAQPIPHKKCLMAFLEQLFKLFDQMPQYIRDDIQKTEGNGHSDKIDAAARWILLHYYQGRWNSDPVTPNINQWEDAPYHYKALDQIASTIAQHFRGGEGSIAKPDPTRVGYLV
jgi:hypothetical protein